MPRAFVSYSHDSNEHCDKVLALGDEETQIRSSFCEAFRIAKEQKSVSLEKRAEATYAEYRRQKASTPEDRGFRLPLW